jgi:phosphatidylinositol alpha-mannosyltransferase
MKIGLICPYSIVKNGGVQEVVRATADHLTRRGHAVRIITPRPQNHDAPAPKSCIFIGRGRDITSRILQTSSQIAGAERDQIAAILEREKFDVLHTHEPWVPLLSAQILQINAKASRRARVVGTFHAKLPERFSAQTLARVVRFYTKPIIGYIDALTAVSPAAAEHLRQLTDRPITIIPNAIDTKKYSAQKLRRQTKTKTILYIGRLEGRKGVKYLLKAFAAMVAARPNTRLVLAGDGHLRERLEQLVQTEQIPNVEFRGFISDADKIRLLHAADLFCSPALYGESFGIVLIEAMAAGTPIVAGNNSGYASVLTGDGGRSLVDPRDVPTFAHTLEQFLTNEQLRRTWRTWAADAIKQYDYDQVVSRYEEIYK